MYVRQIHGRSCELFHLLISIRAGTASLVVFGAIEIRTVVKGPVSSANGSPPALVQKVPVETGERPVLCTFMLHEERALLCSELLQISRGTKGASGQYSYYLDIIFSYGEHEEVIQ